MKKKYLVSLLCATFLLGATASAATSSIVKNIQVSYPSSWTYQYKTEKGKIEEIDFISKEQPFNYQGRVYIPAAVLAKELGFQIEYNPGTKTTTFVSPNSTSGTNNDNLNTSDSANNTNNTSPKNANGEWVYVPQPKNYWSIAPQSEYGVSLPDLSHLPMDALTNGEKLIVPANQVEWNPPNAIFSPNAYRDAGSTLVSITRMVNDRFFDWLDGKITKSELIAEIKEFQKKSQSSMDVLIYGEANLYEAYDMYKTGEEIFDLYIAAVSNPDSYELKKKANGQSEAMNSYWLRLRWACNYYIGYEE